ncbi:MAG: hypothetical protein WC538_21985 [Thermoanaerobaculia bacterium]
MTKPIPITMRVLYVLIQTAGFLKLTRGDIRHLAGLPPDTEITRPIRDLRKEWNGKLNVVHESRRNDASGKIEHVYWLDANDLRRAESVYEARMPR